MSNLLSALHPLNTACELVVLYKDTHSYREKCRREAKCQQRVEGPCSIRSFSMRTPVLSHHHVQKKIHYDVQTNNFNNNVVVYNFI